MSESTKQVELLLQYYTCGDNMYIAKVQRNSYDSPLVELNYIINDGVKLLPTHHKYWFMIPSCTEITSVKKPAPTKYSDVYFILKDEEDATKFSIPEILSKSDTGAWYDDNDTYSYRFAYESEYKKFEQFYESKKDKLPDEYLDVEFEAKYLGEVSVSEINSFADIKVTTLQKNGWSDKTFETDLSKIALYSELSQMLIPEFLIHNQPCQLSGDTFYGIVRNYIKDNIDPSVAHITSDYDFCFTVKKKIRIKPYERKTEVLNHKGKSYKPPRFKTNTVQFKEVKIFEMTPPSKKYGDYTPLDAIKGDNLRELCENVKSYLDELMSVINEPLHECEHCHGLGHIVSKVDDINKR